MEQNTKKEIDLQKPEDSKFNSRINKKIKKRFKSPRR